MMILGIDEVGRGPWAGPLVAGAVVLREPVEGLADSKKLSKKRREVLDVIIRERAWVGLGWVSAAEIDTLGMTKAVQLAMLRAVKELHANGGQYDEIIIDGSINYFRSVNGLQTDRIAAVIKADGSVAAVSAASIVAKVARDRYMVELGVKYPQYGFEKHVGYGTAAHAAALREYGVVAEHRRSFAPIREKLSLTQAK
jgi:ribonuclease HII